MKLQKQLSRKVGGIVYPKYVVVIPPKIVKQAKLKDNEELEIEIKDKKLILKSKV